MKIGFAGPITVSLLADLVTQGESLPLCYGFPMMAHLVREYLRQGHRLSVFALSSDVQARQTFRGEELTIHVVPARKQRAWIDLFASERRLLRQAMQSDPCEVIHAQWTYEFAASAIESGCPHVITAHDALWRVFPYMPLRSLGFWICRGLLCSCVLRHTRCLTVLTDYLKDYYRDRGYCADIAVIPEALADESIDNALMRQHGHVEPVFACVLNGWGRRKNAKAALRGFREYRKRHHGGRLIVFGYGHGQEDPGAKWARAHGLADGVEFAGETEYTHLMRRLGAEVDVLVHPSREESFCISAIEAMNVGVPVIAGRQSGGVGGVVGDGGILLDDVDCINELVAAMEAVTDPNVRQRLGARGRERVTAHYRMSKIAAVYADVLKKALAEQRRKG